MILSDHQCRRLAALASQISLEAPERQGENCRTLVDWDLINRIRAILNERMDAYWADYHTRRHFLKAYRNGKAL